VSGTSIPPPVQTSEPLHLPFPMPKLTLDDLDVRGKRVFIRVDFNVPLREEDGTFVVSDDTRIRAALPTIEAVIERGGKAILASHLGRPKSGPEPRFSLEPVAEYLGGLVDAPVRFAGAVAGAEAAAAVDDLPEGGILLLENTRYEKGETKNDEGLARQFAELADVFVNDAFGSAHRAHASTEGITRFVEQSALGYLLQREVDALSRLLEAPEKPFVAVLGGAKVSDKIALIEQLLDRVDELLIGGAMAYTFLKALGRNVGTSRIEEDRLDIARELFERADGRIKLPTDHVVAAEFAADAPHEIVAGDIPDGMMGLDVGPETLAAYREALLKAKTIVWNGPMGVFEMAAFNKGTFWMAETLAEATDQGAFTVVGGGDSVAAITQAGYEDRVSHVSTGGGAMLEFMEGKELPGIAALSEK
jgi:phosphoglycerate kinase